jgi:hypothetical protein
MKKQAHNRRVRESVMRQTVYGLAISGLVAAIAIMAGGAAPASACERQVYAGPCAQVYGPAYGYFGCYSGCSVHERLPDPELQYHSVSRRPQYYYVNQGPTYTGPGDFAPYPTYQEAAVYGWDSYRAHPRSRAWRYHGQPILRRYY